MEPVWVQRKQCLGEWFEIGFEMFSRLGLPIMIFIASECVHQYNGKMYLRI